MPLHSRTSLRPARSGSFRRIALRAAAATGAVLAIGGGIAVSTIAQGAAAEELERRILTEQLNDTADVRSEQLDVYDAILEQRLERERVLAEQAAAERAAYLASLAGAQETARDMAASIYGWGEDQFSCLVSLWNRESGWSVNAYNASSGATGIPQALPGEKMAIAGADWQTNPATQIAWGLSYISSSYGTPCSAWGHSQSYNWY